MLRAVEAVVVGGMGAALGAGLGSLIGERWVICTFAIVAGLNGLVTGAMGMYRWSGIDGWAAFVADSTWGLFGVALALVLHIANAFRGSPMWVVDMCRRTNRFVYEKGVAFKRGFALAQGNVISNAGGRVGLRGEGADVAKRRSFVVAHEGIHVLQSRIFGPLYQLIYVAWLILGGLAGVAVWFIRDRQNFGQIVETFAYYNNPFEYWAYNNDNYWPPRGAHKAYAWGGAKDLDA